jgi:DNA-binding NarL/FixJ family response regulator
MSKTTFVITDDAIFMRTLLRKIIEQGEDYEVLGEASMVGKRLKQQQSISRISLPSTLPCLSWTVFKPFRRY